MADDPPDSRSAGERVSDLRNDLQDAEVIDGVFNDASDWCLKWGRNEVGRLGEPAESN